MTNNKSGRRRVTIKDIAREAGVDKSTVTRALQGSTRVKASTRESIERIAQQLGYVPSAIARSLVTQRSQLIGLVIPDMTNPFFAPLARGIEDEAARHSLRVLIRNTEGRQEAERDAIKIFRELSVDGMIVPAARCPQAFYDQLPDSTHVIHINRQGAAHQVSCDSVSGSAKIMSHLLSLGHRRIAFVTGPAGPALEPKRFAYKQALKDADITLRDENLFTYDGTLRSVDQIADALVGQRDRPSAVFAWNDVCAIALIHALHKRGVDVPGEMSIAGHDDIEMAGIIHPPLTTVRWPMYELGLQAVRYVLRLHAGDAPVRPGIPAPTLVVRESTAAPPK